VNQMSDKHECIVWIPGRAGEYDPLYHLSWSLKARTSLADLLKVVYMEEFWSHPLFVGGSGLSPQIFLNWLADKPDYFRLVRATRIMAEAAFLGRLYISDRSAYRQARQFYSRQECGDEIIKLAEHLICIYSSAKRALGRMAKPGATRSCVPYAETLLRIFRDSQEGTNANPMEMLMLMLLWGCSQIPVMCESPSSLNAATGIPFSDILPTLDRVFRYPEDSSSLPVQELFDEELFDEGDLLTGSAMICAAWKDSLSIYSVIVASGLVIEGSETILGVAQLLKLLLDVNRVQFVDMSTERRGTEIPVHTWPYDWAMDETDLPIDDGTIDGCKSRELFSYAQKKCMLKWLAYKNNMDEHQAITKAVTRTLNELFTSYRKWRSRGDVESDPFWHLNHMLESRSEYISPVKSTVYLAEKFLKEFDEETFAQRFKIGVEELRLSDLGRVRMRVIENDVSNVPLDCTDGHQRPAPLKPQRVAQERRILAHPTFFNYHLFSCKAECLYKAECLDQIHSGSEPLSC